MNRAFSFILLFAVPVLAQDAAKKPEPAKAGEGLTDAVEIFKKADDAAKAVKSVKYEATAKGLGANAARVPKIEGTAILVGWTGSAQGGPQKWYYEAKITAPDSSDIKTVKGGSDGDKFFLLDMVNKKAYEDIDPAVLGSFARALRQGITMAEFVHPTPFSDEINGEKHEFKGTTDVAGEKCYEVHVKYANNPQDAHWFFSTKDFLPRRVDRWSPGREGGERGGTELIVTKLTVQPKLDDSMFKLTVPEGFTKVDDFAP